MEMLNKFYQFPVSIATYEQVNPDDTLLYCVVYFLNAAENFLMNSAVHGIGVNGILPQLPPKSLFFNHTFCPICHYKEYLENPAYLPTTDTKAL